MSTTATINYKDTPTRVRLEMSRADAENLKSGLPGGKNSRDPRIASLYQALPEYSGADWVEHPLSIATESVEGDKVPDTVTITMPYDVARGLKAYLFAAATWSRTQGGRAARDLHDALSDGGITADYSAPKAGA